MGRFEPLDQLLEVAGHDVERGVGPGVAERDAAHEFDRFAVDRLLLEPTSRLGLERFPGRCDCVEG